MKKFLLLMFMLFVFSCNVEIPDDSVLISYSGFWGREYGFFSADDLNYYSRNCAYSGILPADYQLDYLDKLLIVFNRDKDSRETKVVDFYNLETLNIENTITVKNMERSDVASDMQIRDNYFYYHHYDTDDSKNDAVYRIDLSDFSRHKIFSRKTSYFSKMVIIGDDLFLSLVGPEDLDVSTYKAYTYPYKRAPFTSVSVRYNFKSAEMHYLAHTELSWSEKYKVLAYIDDKSQNMVIHNVIDGNEVKLNLTGIDFKNIWDYQVVSPDTIFIKVFDHKVKQFDPLGGIFGNRYDNFHKLYLVNVNSVTDLGVYKHLILHGSF